MKEELARCALVLAASMTLIGCSGGQDAFDAIAAQGASEVRCADESGDVETHFVDDDMTASVIRTAHPVTDLTSVVISANESAVVVSVPFQGDRLTDFDAAISAVRPGVEPTWWESSYHLTATLEYQQGYLAFSLHVRLRDGLVADTSAGFFQVAGQSNEVLAEGMDAGVRTLAAEGDLMAEFSRADLPRFEVSGVPAVSAGTLLTGRWANLYIVDGSSQATFVDDCGAAAPGSGPPLPSPTSAPPEADAACEGVSDCQHDNGIDVSQLREEIRTTLRREGRHIGDVNCDVGAPPDSVPAGQTFICEVYASEGHGGGTVEVTVLEEGAYTWEVITYSDVAG